jgi:hypothetical protein
MRGVMLFAEFRRGEGVEVVGFGTNVDALGSCKFALDRELGSCKFALVREPGPGSRSAWGLFDVDAKACCA